MKSFASARGLLWSVLLAASVALGVAPALAGPTDKTGVGDPSQGSYFRTLCQTHAAITSVLVIVDDQALKSMQPTCMMVDMQGQWTGRPLASYPAAVMRLKQFTVSDDSVLTNKRVALCPNGSYLVGTNPGVTRVDGTLMPWHTGIECWVPQSGDVLPSSYYIPPSALDGNHYMMGWDGVGGARSCNSGEVGVGFWGKLTNDYVEALGLVCAPWSEVMPHPMPHIEQTVRTPTEVVRDKSIKEDARQAFCTAHPADCATRP